MARLAIILYSYPARIARHRYLARLCYGQISAIPDVLVFVTTEQGGGLGEPSCFRHMELSSPRGYEFLPDKTLAMFRWFLDHTDCQYLLKCDDDVVLDPAAIRQLLQRKDMPDYQGADIYSKPAGATAYTCHRGKCTQPALNETDTDVSWAPEGFTFAGGPCYLLSRKAVLAAVREVDISGFCTAAARESRDNRGVGAEDWLVADLLLRQGICVTHSLRLMHCDNWFLMLKQFRWELCARLTRRNSLKRCMGICTSNRVPTWWETLQIRAWLPVSRLVAPT